jgi:4,5-DOPA dioxygenase extradiol
MIPSYFLAHGSPIMVIEDTEYTRFLKDFEQKIKPKAIVIFTAHWEEDILTISSKDDVYDTIYDFYGFPDKLYTLKYEAKGSKQIAAILEERFKKHGIAVRKDTERGLDHGSWTLLYHMYPKADIPVVQVSVNPYLSPEEQYRIGAAIRDLREEDIMIIGSGVTVHNLRLLKRQNPDEVDPWAVEFDDWLLDKLKNKDLDSLFHYEDLAPYVQIAVPRAEHFVPFFIAMGSGDPHADAKVIHRSYRMGSLSNLCVEF